MYQELLQVLPGLHLQGVLQPAVHRHSGVDRGPLYRWTISERWGPIKHRSLNIFSTYSIHGPRSLHEEGAEGVRDLLCPLQRQAEGDKPDEVI